MQIYNIHSFIESLKQNKNIKLDPDGQWHIDGLIPRWLRRIGGSERKGIAQFISAFIGVLDHLEIVPVRFTIRPGIYVKQNIDYHSYLIAAQLIKNKYSSYSYREIKKQLGRLKQRVIALLYRLEEENGGLQIGGSNIELFWKLQAAATDWKESQKIFWHHQLSSVDVKQLEKACCYPEFVKLMFEDSYLMDDFFFWVLRDGLDPGPYIEFPAFQRKITDSLLRGRIGRVGGDLLKVQKQLIGGTAGSKQKLLTLPFEGVEGSILDLDKQITFRGNYTLTIREILHIFKHKLVDAGNLEFFAQGITNWQTNYLGWWDADRKTYVVIDLQEKEWWKALPTLEVLSLDQAQKRYGNYLNGQNWNLAAKATREFINLHFEKTHAYLEIAIPDASGKEYTIYDFGKCATKLPANSWEGLKMFCLSVPASIAYPDDNIYFSNRQHIGYSFEIIPEQGLQYMNSLREDILMVREGNSVYQIETENCGKWIQLRLEEHLGKERVPNLYRVPILSSEPMGIASKIFKMIWSLPRYWQEMAIKLVHFPFGSWKGQWIVEKNGQKVWKSLLHSTFWQDTVVYLPAYLHKQQEEGVFAFEPDRHKVTIRGYFDAKTKKSTSSEQDPFAALELFDENT